MGSRAEASCDALVGFPLRTWDLGAIVGDRLTVALLTLGRVRMVLVGSGLMGSMQLLVPLTERAVAWQASPTATATAPVAVFFLCA
ncbi:MAG: hypothetical protein AAFZ18_11630 [Myxococcota bacterium]